MSKPATFRVDLEMHVYPVLHLARVAVAMEAMLYEIQSARTLLPGLDESLKNLGCSSDYGTSVADYADLAILAATDLLEAHQTGPVFVVSHEGGAA